MRRGFLAVQESNQEKRRVPIVSTLVVGRSADCDISIDDAAASRHHAEVWLKEGSFYWKDLGSTNGTLLNGIPMLEGLLKHGDMLQIGETVLSFEIEEVAETAQSEDSTLFTTLSDGEGHAIARSPEDLKTEGLLRAVYTIMNQIASNYEPCSLVDQILETSMRAIDAQRGAVLFAGADGEDLLPCPACGKFHVVQKGKLRHVDREGAQISSTVAHRVLSLGESVLYQDAQSAGDLNAAESIVSLNLRSIMCVPLRGKFGILGLLYVDSTEPDQVYTREDMLLTTAVGNSAGLALENARMHRQVVDKERMDQEIQHAWTIQEGFLVKEWPQEDFRYKVYGETRPAKVVGGDFYDFVQLDKDRIGMLIGDVSGKGVPAALAMAQILAAFRLSAVRIASPAKVLATINQDLFKRSRFGMFCTMCFLTQDLKTGGVRSANAGHHPVLCVGKDGVRQFAEASGPPLGVLAEVPWVDTETTVKPGETILLYTDGIVEARGMHTRRGTTSRMSDEFGIKNLCRVAQGFAKESPREMITGINVSVREYTAPALPHDDCTMIALCYEGVDGVQSA